jgi:hypothetical protein
MCRRLHPTFREAPRTVSIGGRRFRTLKVGSRKTWSRTCSFLPATSYDYYRLMATQFTGPIPLSGGGGRKRRESTSKRPEHVGHTRRVGSEASPIRLPVGAIHQLVQSDTRLDQVVEIRRRASAIAHVSSRLFQSCLSCWLRDPNRMGVEKRE